MSDKKIEPYYTQQAERYIYALERTGYLSDFAKGANRKPLVEYTANLLQLYCELYEKIGAITDNIEQYDPQKKYDATPLIQSWQDCRLEDHIKLAAEKLKIDDRDVFLKDIIKTAKVVDHKLKEITYGKGFKETKQCLKQNSNTS